MTEAQTEQAVATGVILTDGAAAKVRSVFGNYWSPAGGYVPESACSGRGACCDVLGEGDRPVTGVVDPGNWCATMGMIASRELLGP